MRDVFWMILSIGYLWIGVWTVWAVEHRRTWGHVYDTSKEVAEWTKGLVLYGVLFAIIGVSNAGKHASDTIFNGPSEIISAIALASAIGVSGAVMLWQWQFTREVLRWKAQAQQSLQGVLPLRPRSSQPSSRSGSETDSAA